MNRTREIPLILVVDDEPDMRAAVTRTLRKPGWDVVQAACGEEALALAAGTSPDLVLLDVNLPDIEGPEVCRRLKADPATASIPVIHLSASSISSRQQVEGLEAGADGYMTHPIEPEELLARVRAFLRIKRSEDRLREELEKRRTLEAIVSASPVVAILWRQEPGWPVAFVSDGIRQFGYEPVEFLEGRRSFDDILLPEDRGRLHEEARAHREAGRESWTQRYRILRADGSLRWVEDRTSVHRSPDGAIGHHQGILLDVTDQVEAEQRLSESEARFRNLIATQGEGVGIVDAEERFIFANPAGEAIFGVPEGTLPGRPLEEFLGEEELAKIKGQTARRVSGEHTAYELTIRRPDGSLRDLLVTGTPQFDAKERFIGTLGIFRDITERKAMERALKESEARLRTMADAALDAIIMMDPEGRISFWSAAAQRIFGYEESEALGASLHRLLAPRAYHGAYAKAFETFTVSGEGSALNQVLEMQALRKDGEEFPVELSLSPVRMGDRWHAVGIVRDITERKRADAELREKTEELNLYFSTALDLFCIADPDARFRHLNAHWEEVLGYPLEELLGRRFLDFVHPDDVAATQAVMGRLESQEAVLSFINRYRHRDGSYRWLEWKSIPKGDLIFAAARDITERLEREARARELEEQASRAKAAQAMWNLTQGLAHEVRNPLFAIQTNVSAMKLRIPATPDLDQHMAHVEQHLRRLSLLMQDLTEMGKPLQTGTLESADLAEVVRSAATAEEGAKRGDAGRLRWEGPPGAIPMRLHRSKIVQAVRHLVRNALDFSPEGSPVSVRVSAGGGEALLTVTDRGPGLPQVVRDRVFEPFVTSETGRSGLGLAMVRHFVESHGGTVEASDAEGGGGTVFTVRLPLETVGG